ncbi:hypothetical protein RJ639_039076 [Escallonia herrerae]|uniref:CDP-diacylglycerol--inositol 3-phosphatidyltransferase n=1 Tax=Escallonia herrerae TaxID=1293975 RepID=A0AA88WKJ5_9ASTE|nr:hypothetical protein RJ639_039076 [Escallonia herrerae]
MEDEPPSRGVGPRSATTIDNITSLSRPCSGQSQPNNGQIVVQNHRCHAITAPLPPRSGQSQPTAGYIRILLNCVAFALCFYEKKLFSLQYFISFVCDALDGWFARKFNQVPVLTFGAVLDMVTDRISTACLLVILSQVYSTFLVGKASHKDVNDSSNRLFKAYYGYMMFKGYCCVACEVNVLWNWFLLVTYSDANISFHALYITLFLLAKNQTEIMKDVLMDAARQSLLQCVLLALLLFGWAIKQSVNVIQNDSSKLLEVREPVGLGQAMSSHTPMCGHGQDFGFGSGKMIGNAKESKGLYRIRADDHQDTQAHHVFLSEINSSGNKELKVYSRRQKNPKPVEPHMHPEPCQTDVPSPTPTEVIQGNLDSSSSTDDLCLLNDLNKPIAHRKGVRSCTKLPISQFVSHEKLSPSFRAFTTNLDNTTVPSFI